MIDLFRDFHFPSVVKNYLVRILITDHVETESKILLHKQLWSMLFAKLITKPHTWLESDNIKAQMSNVSKDKFDI